MEYRPYCYLIGWSNQNLWYYGSSYMNSVRGIAHPNHLWEKYFTSSIIVANCREMYGEPDVVEIRKTFNNGLDTRRYEYKVLRRLKVVTNRKWLNMFAGKPKDVSGENNPNYGKTTPDHVKKKISDSLKGKHIGEDNPNFGNNWTVDMKKKLSDKRKINWTKSKKDIKIQHRKQYPSKVHIFHHPDHGVVEATTFEMELDYDIPAFKFRRLANGKVVVMKEGWNVPPL